MGINPKLVPHPLALQILRENFKIDVSDACSKSWKEFNDVSFNFVITLCDSPKETWPGQPNLHALEFTETTYDLSTSQARLPLDRITL